MELLNEYGNYKFYFRLFDSIEQFKDLGKKAVDSLTTTEKLNPKYSSYTRTSFTDKEKETIGTTFEEADKGEFYEYIDKPALERAIESFDLILNQIEMGGETKKSKIVITDDKRGIFDFGLASKGLFRVVEFYSKILAEELPLEFPTLYPGVVPNDLVQKDNFGQFYYKSSTNQKDYYLIRRQKGTTSILYAKPDCTLKYTDNGIEYTSINKYKGLKLEFASSTKKAYVMFAKKGGKARYVDLYCVIGGLSDLSSLNMLSRALPVLLAAKYLENNGIKTRIFGLRTYQSIFYKDKQFTKNGKRYIMQEAVRDNEFINIAIKLKDYSQDIDFNWLAINLTDTRFFRWNLWKYTSAILIKEGNFNQGNGFTIYGGNELNEVFGRYKNWYFSEMDKGRIPENRIDRNLMITGGLEAPTPELNEIESKPIIEEFHRILDVVDFQFNTPEKAAKRIYDRIAALPENYYKETYQIKSIVSKYIIKVLSDAYAYPSKGMYASPLSVQDKLTDEYEKTIDAVSSFLNSIK